MCAGTYAQKRFFYKRNARSEIRTLDLPATPNVRSEIRTFRLYVPGALVRACWSTYIFLVSQVGVETK